MEKPIRSLIRRIVPLSFLALAVISCNDEPSSNIKGDSVSRGIEITPAERQASSQCNIFAWNLLQRCTEIEDDDCNVVISPLSANICLSMVANGASGNCRQQILRGLGFNEGDIENLNSLNSQLALQICGIDDNVTLSLANSFWYKEEIMPKLDFLSDLWHNYAIQSFPIKQATFSSDANRWCYDNTNGLIPRIIEEENPRIFAFLNAIYFKGLWHSDFRFEKEKTFIDYFINSDATKPRVSYMHHREVYPYHVAQLWRAMRIPFGGGGFSFTVILPNDGVSVDECLASIKEFEPATATYSNMELDLKLPKLSINHNQDLVQVLKGMGMTDMFDPTLAELSNMTDYDLAVDMVKQNVSFELDECGAQAAAVTIAEDVDTAPGFYDYANFYVDHPFIFMISERSTGAILFLGRINKL